MCALSFLYFIALLTMSASDNGEIQGIVREESGKVLPDVVVYIDGPKLGQPPKKNPSMEQRDKKFIPHVLAVLVGSKVDFPNNDEVLHNVFSVFHGKKFDLGLFPRGARKTVKFDKPGIHVLFCNIHPHMNAYILVLENPYFSITDAKGAFSIKDIPAGEYTLKAWHELYPEQERKVNVPSRGKVDLTLTLKWGAEQKEKSPTH
jgi:plastocyanin